MSRWINAKKELPRQDGRYLTVTSDKYVDILSYSAKYKAFTQWEIDDEESAKAESLDVVYWKPISKLPKDIK